MIIHKNGAHRNIHLFPFVIDGAVVRAAFRIKFCRQFPAVLQVFTRQDRTEFISADAEYGAVPEYPANHAHCRYQVFVALLVAVSVIDVFEVVAVKHAYRKFRHFSARYALPQHFDVIVETAFVAHRGQCIHIDALAQVVCDLPVLLRILLRDNQTPLYDDHHQHRQDQNDHRDDQQQILPHKFKQTDIGFLILGEILGQRHIDRRAGHDVHDFVQDRIQLGIRLVHGDTGGDIVARVQGDQMILFAQLSEVVVAVAADQDAIRLAVGYGFETILNAVTDERLPLRIKVQQDRVIIMIILFDSSRDLVCRHKALFIVTARQCRAWTPPAPA